MHVYIVFTYPSKKSFSKKVLEAFIKGLEQAQHTYEIADLYEMGFVSEMEEALYLRETSGNSNLPVPPDIEMEHIKINRAQGLAFVFPLWWSDCPVKLKGWFDRVLTCGYAYFYEPEGDRNTRISIDKALVICSAGHTAEHLEETGIADSMRNIMLNDRLLGVGVKKAYLEILGGMMPLDDTHCEINLSKAYTLGRDF